MLAVLRNVNIANLTYSSPTPIYSTQTHTHSVSAQCTHVLTFRANAYSPMRGISFFLASFCFLCTVAKLVSPKEGGVPCFPAVQNCIHYAEDIVLTCRGQRQEVH